MRTTDFTKAPKQGRAEAILIVELPRGRGAKSPTGSRLSALVAGAKRADGFVWLKSYRRLGYANGIIVCFDSGVEAAAHQKTAVGASTRLLTAEPSGYSNGVWRAEGNVMAHIEHFTPTSVEVGRGSTPPLVAAPVSSAATRDPAMRGTAPRTSKRHDPETRGSAHRPLADAQAMFIGATKYRGIRSLILLSRTWYPMIARMRTLRGYVWHTVYWEPPFTLGTLAFFATRDDLLSFARLPAHRLLMQWITRDTSNGTGGYIRLHVAPDAKAADGVAGRAAEQREDERSAP